MSTFNIVSGMPRAGSTLLCNLLNQRPDTYASSTSALASNVSGILASFQSPEEKSRLANIEGTEFHHQKILRDFCLNWHDSDAQYIFDKGRLWTHGVTQLRSFMPAAKVLICIRDPRNVLASIEKQHQKSGLYGQGDLATRVQNQMAPQGLVGGPMMGITDILNRPQLNDSIHYVIFERFVFDPASTMEKLEKALDIPAHDYDFDNVENTATDLDILYSNQFPHEGSGKVREPTYDWKDYLTPEMAEWAIERFPKIAQKFGYE